MLFLNKMTEKVEGTVKLGMKCSDAICGTMKFPRCPIRELRETGRSRAIEMISPVTNSRISAQATEVEWEGKKAYMISCTPLDD